MLLFSGLFNLCGKVFSTGMEQLFEDTDLLPGTSSGGRTDLPGTSSGGRTDLPGTSSGGRAEQSITIRKNVRTITDSLCSSQTISVLLIVYLVFQATFHF